MIIRFYIAKLFKKIFSPSSIRGSNIYKTANVGDGCAIADSSLGRYSYVGDYTTVSSSTIGSFCSISSNCSIGGGAHPVDWVSTSPVFTSGRNRLRMHFSEKPFEPHKTTTIGNDVWIGTHAVIKSGITIGDGAVIGMGSVVTHDVPPYEVWAGNPAHLIRKRFDEGTIVKLNELQWWMWPDNELKQYAEYFDSVDVLYEHYKKRKVK